MTIPVISITGPTASGKSSLADEVASRLHTDVISADAMQVYVGMDIGTAKTPEPERRVPLRLVDIVSPSESYSAALYQHDARAIIDSLLSAGKPAILCGGTGLYLRAALDEMEFPKGEVEGERRSRYQHMAEELGPEGLHALLREKDPASADQIHHTNVRRVDRALEMIDEGISYADQKAGFSTPRAHYDYVSFALTMDRDRLYKRIDDRVDIMMHQGLLDEVKGLVASGAADAITSRQAIGYKEIIDYLEGICSLADAVSLIKQRSRRYAKRQLSWCRRDDRTIWLDMDQLSTNQAADFIMEKTGY